MFYLLRFTMQFGSLNPFDDYHLEYLFRSLFFFDRPLLFCFSGKALFFAGRHEGRVCSCVHRQAGVLGRLCVLYMYVYVGRNDTPRGGQKNRDIFLNSSHMLLRLKQGYNRA